MPEYALKGPVQSESSYSLVFAQFVAYVNERMLELRAGLPDDVIQAEWKEEFAAYSTGLLARLGPDDRLPSHVTAAKKLAKKVIDYVVPTEREVDLHSSVIGELITTAWFGQLRDGRVIARGNRTDLVSFLLK